MPRPTLPRLHLFEIEDQAWLPGWLRGYLTDCLRVIFGAFVGRTEVANRLADLLRATGENRVLDLCSGSSGPMVPLLRQLERDHGLAPTVLASDKFPNREASRALELATGGRLRYVPTPVDALAVPAELPGVRTLFAGLHHFRPAEARAILADAVKSGRGLAAFEVSERRASTFFAVLLLPFVVLLVTPFLFPPSPRRWFFTYVLPLVPALVAWDGWVSCLRSYTVEELGQLARQTLDELGVDAESYRFDVARDRVAGLPVGITSIVGRPMAPVSDLAPVSGLAPARSQSPGQNQVQDRA